MADTQADMLSIGEDLSDVGASDPSALKVLVVDDDPSALRLITKIISTAGYCVLEAHDGQQALDRIISDCPGLLITDWEMPGLDGVQLCREIRQRDLPFYLHVLLVTAKSQADEMVQALNAGANDFISKPINRAVLLARVRAGARTVAMERKLRHIGESDSLTGAMNRRAFHQRLGAEWERAMRNGHALSCVMLDLDYFKKLNDTFGHAAGDVVLQSVVRQIESHCRVSDVVARFGGEEFCVMLTDTAEAGAAAWADRLRVSIAESRIPFLDQPLSVTASFGIAAWMADIASPDALIDLADQAMYVAKELGRNRVVSFSSLSDPGPTSSAALGAYSPLDKVLARDVMAPAVYCPREGDSVDRVADLLLQLRLNAAPVIDDQSRLAGIISDNDLLAFAASTPSLHAPVRECMKTNVVRYDEETPAKTIYQFISRASVPRVVVVRDGRPTGVISRATLLHWLRNWSIVHGQSDDVTTLESDSARRAGVLKAADAAGDRLAALRNHVYEMGPDFVPCAVAEATRLEELAHEILAQCRGQARL